MTSARKQALPNADTGPHLDPVPIFSCRALWKVNQSKIKTKAHKRVQPAACLQTATMKIKGNGIWQNPKILLRGFLSDEHADVLQTVRTKEYGPSYLIDNKYLFYTNRVSAAFLTTTEILSTIPRCLPYFRKVCIRRRAEPCSRGLR